MPKLSTIEPFYSPFIACFWSNFYRCEILATLLVTYKHGGVVAYSGRPCGVSFWGMHSAPSAVPNALAYRTLETWEFWLLQWKALARSIRCLRVLSPLRPRVKWVLNVASQDNHFPGRLASVLRWKLWKMFSSGERSFDYIVIGKYNLHIILYKTHLIFTFLQVVGSVIEEETYLHLANSNFLFNRPLAWLLQHGYPRIKL